MIKNKIKILYVSPNGYLGGAEDVLINIASNHNKKHFSPMILFFKPGEAQIKAQELNIETHVLKHRFRLRNPFTLFISILELRRFIKSSSPDIIHNTMAYSQIIISLAALGLNIKTVWFQHGPVGGMLDRIASLFHTDALIFNSHFLKEMHFKKINPSNIPELILKLGIPSPKKFNNILEKEIFTIGMAGRITSIKCYELTIDAMKILKERNDSLPFKLIIAGSPKTSLDQTYFEKLQEQIRLNHLEEYIQFIGHQKEMSHFFSQIDIFIHPSLTPEPFALVVAQAMSYGCLCMTFPGGGINDYLFNNQTGICIKRDEGHETQNIVDALTLFLDLDKDPKEKERFQRLAREGQDYILKNYSNQNMINQIENLYEQI